MADVNPASRDICTYIISDLHLGGAFTPGQRGFRICTQSAALVEFIGALAAKSSTGPLIELVINGDMVDFLAEQNTEGPKWSAFTADPKLAVEKLDRIAARESAFFAALNRYVQQGHRLVVLLGNHDIELCLPPVRARLETLLGVTGASDYLFIYDGEAYIRGEVLIEHGNRYDKFNVVDYDALRRIRSLLSRSQPVPERYRFNPPAGSKMVADVINPIKETYGFVDLLKPESGAVVPLLLALEPATRNFLAQAVPHAYEASKHGMETPSLPSIGGDISGTSTAGDIGSDIGSGFGGDMGSFVAPPPTTTPLDDVLAEHLGAGAGEFKRQLESPDADIGAEISTFDTVKGFARLLMAGKGEPLQQRLKALLGAIRALQHDRTFDETIETALEYREAAVELGQGKFKAVIFGHTHQAKDIELGHGLRYLNTGTWADVMQFPVEIICGTDAQIDAKMTEFADRLRRGDFAGWSLFNPTYVRINTGVAGQKIALCHYRAGEPV